MRNIYIALLSILTFGCSEDFLDKSPSVSNSVEITSVDDIDKLFNGINIPFTDDQVNIWCTDNAYVPQAVLDESFTITDEQLAHYTFETDVDRTRDGQWSGYYRYLLLPNLALDQIAGGELISEDPVLLAETIAEAHFRRAFHLFQAAVVYSLYPNDSNLNEMGVVLKQTSSITESLARATVKETFDFIKADIEEALKHPIALKQSPFRTDKPSVHALAARVYLYLGEYEKAKTHADAALNGYNAMVDYATSIYELPYSLWYGPFTYPNSVELRTWDISIPELYTDEYFYVESSNGNWNTSPSQELLDLYDPNDIRNMFFIDGWFSRSGVTTNTWTSYMDLGPGTSLAGPGVAEMYLTRAECKARDNDITGAMADVEMVRVNRFKPADYVALPIPSTVKETVEEIIDERRREDPFEYRFMDIKRLNNDDLTDSIILTRVVNGETVTIQPDDRRYARPIGNEIILLSKGETVQNKY
ncbi:RagB/SusD family nutrient uptake outer membrane protein [Tamlana haliotis]|uniref:RagB/SusD family nutrient uptake outer membrane protein n=1 Tax=Pseudotamlana haliotis TaxID=2614804 RepID=A0A6N6MEH5_9FLAO|nr:RagB/SusD family nutrient uptake outer membrane protein [Tamlana haliotis]KAB1068152.1 RagB/SusD family nutrient uptake outer membrane protein [Tamlana haliotis]